MGIGRLSGLLVLFLLLVARGAAAEPTAAERVDAILDPVQRRPAEPRLDMDTVSARGAVTDRRSRALRAYYGVFYARRWQYMEVSRPAPSVPRGLRGHAILPPDDLPDENENGIPDGREADPGRVGTTSDVLIDEMDSRNGDVYPVDLADFGQASDERQPIPPVPSVPRPTRPPGPVAVQRISRLINTYRGFLNLAWVVDPRNRLDVVARANYAQDVEDGATQLDSYNMDVRAGLEQKRPGWAWIAPVGYVRRGQNNVRLSSAVFFEPAIAYNIQRGFDVVGRYRYERETFYNLRRSESDNETQTLTLVSRFRRSGHALTGRVDAVMSKAHEARNNFRGWAALVQYATRLPHDMLLLGSYRFARRAFNDPNGRADNGGTVTVMLARRVGGFQISGGYSWSHNNSNNPLYEFSRREAVLNLRATF